MKVQALSILFLYALTPAWGQNSIIGKWKTVDENSGTVKSIVEIYEKNQKIYGKILKIFPGPGEDPDPVCNECDESDPRFMKKILGMVIIQDLTKDGEEYEGGEVLDPEDGKVYRCKIWLEGADLKIRGYWGPFYRTQTWKREP